MRSDLIALEAELNEISALIDSYQRADALHAHILTLDDLPDSVNQPAIDLAYSKTLHRKYNYISVIIGLYGAIEQYVEAIISSYSKVLPKICGKFDNIPEDIRVKHHELTVEYLSAIKQRRVHDPEDVNTVVRRLAQCRSRARIYEFNSRAFTLRTANMNFERVRLLANNLKIQVTPRRLVNTISFSSYYENKNGVALPAIGDTEAKAAFSLVDDLVSRRNRIAHGANSVDDIEDYPLLSERVDHLRMYGRALYEIFEDHALRICVEKSRTSTLGVPIRKFSGNIVCFQLDDGNISVGDVIIVMPSDDNFPAKQGGILSLRVDNISHLNIVGSPGCLFGAKLPFNPSQTASYGVLHSDLASILDL